MATTKKSPPTKAAAKSKPKSEEKDSKEESEEGVQEVETQDLEEVAREVLDGKWNSGRERDILLTEAGYDPRAIQSEVAKLRSQT